MKSTHAAMIVLACLSPLFSKYANADSKFVALLGADGIRLPRIERPDETGADGQRFLDRKLRRTAR